MLDTDIPLNDPADRPITGSLYVRGREMRLCQEIVLGIGGVRALRALGIYPAVWHMNEGHVAFLGLERARERVQPRRRPHGGARATSPRNTVFTTHTPVPAGNETFDRELVKKYLGPWTQDVGCEPEAALGLGADNGNFNLTVLAIRLSSSVERREQAARRGLLRDVAAPVAGRARDARRLRHERRAHRELDRAGDARALRAPPGRRTGSTTSSSPSVDARRTRSPTRRSGPPTARRRSA